MKLLTVAWPDKFTGSKKLYAALCQPFQLRNEWNDIVIQAVARTRDLRLVDLTWKDGPANVEWYSSADLGPDIGGRCWWRGQRAWIVLADTRMDRDDDYRLTLAMHELGHSMRLAHPKHEDDPADTIMHHELKRIGEDEYRPEWGKDDVRRLKAKFR
jgi:hypothetical protein